MLPQANMTPILDFVTEVEAGSRCSALVGTDTALGQRRLQARSQLGREGREMSSAKRFGRHQADSRSGTGGAEPVAAQKMWSRLM